MQEARENGQEGPSGPMICGREFNMSELSDTARQCGDKLTDAASRASDYVSDKVSADGNKIKDLQGKDISEIADEARVSTQSRILGTTFSSPRADASSLISDASVATASRRSRSALNLSICLRSIAGSTRRVLIWEASSL